MSNLTFEARGVLPASAEGCTQGSIWFFFDYKINCINVSYKLIYPNNHDHFTISTPCPTTIIAVYPFEEIKKDVLRI